MEMQSVGSQSDNCDLWRTLAAAGPKAIAEALTAPEMERLHVPTSVETFVSNLIANGTSVVLTGNAGDGKTHVMRRIKEQVAKSGAHVVEDATALMRGDDPTPVIDKWTTAIQAGAPFCLAANEYPLFQLRNYNPKFPQLLEVDRQCEHRLAYGPTRHDEVAKENIVVLDLSLRNPLSYDFFNALLQAMLQDAAVVAMARESKGSASARNHALLSTPIVSDRLRDLTSRLVAIGHRATVRELWILIAKMVFGVKEPKDFKQADWYSEILFRKDVRFDVTDALRDVDPALSSHPVWDVILENREPRARAGWAVSAPALPPHPQLDNETFSALKRRFYFEHESGDKVFELSDPDWRQFHDILSGKISINRQLVSDLVAGINSAYCPVSFSGREHHLYLWNGHRFHEQPSRSFVAASRISADQFVLEIPRLPLRLAGAFSYHPDHIALTVQTHKTHRLRLDFPLYRTLARLRRGLPRKLIPERDIHRLDAFLEKLTVEIKEDRQTVWSAHLENLEVIQVNLSHDKARYEGIRRYE